MPIVPDGEKPAILLQQLRKRPDQCLLLRSSEEASDGCVYVVAVGDQFRVTFVRDEDVIDSCVISEDEMRGLILAWEPLGIRLISGTPVDEN